MGKNLTHTEFLEKLHERNKHYKEGKFEVISKYVDSKTKILLKDSLGEYECHTTSILRGNFPNVKSLVSNLKDFIDNYLSEHNPNFVGELEVLSRSFNWHKMYFKTKYGIIKLSMKSLLNLKNISLRSAMFPQDFWVRRAKDLRSDSNSIDYSNCFYQDNSHKVELRCRIHDYIYEQRPSHHTANIQGCPYCAKQTIKYSKENFQNHKEFFKNRKGFFYVLRLYNDTENFYKIGITGQNRTKYRTEQLSKDYNIDLEYKLLDTLENCFILEQRFLKEFEMFKYKPKKHFTGYTECLTVNPIDYYYYCQEQQNKLLHYETY